MARTKSDEKKTAKRMNIGATVTPQVKEALDEFHWTARKNISEIVSDAIEAYLVANGIAIPEAPKAEAE